MFLDARRGAEARLKISAVNLSASIDVVRLCFERGIKLQHSEIVISKLKRENLLKLIFGCPMSGD
jgi:hypothetical protein